MRFLFSICAKSKRNPKNRAPIFRSAIFRLKRKNSLSLLGDRDNGTCCQNSGRCCQSDTGRFLVAVRGLFGVLFDVDFRRYVRRAVLGKKRYGGLVFRHQRGIERPRGVPDTVVRRSCIGFFAERFRAAVNSGVPNGEQLIRGELYLLDLRPCPAAVAENLLFKSRARKTVLAVNVFERCGYRFLFVRAVGSACFTGNAGGIAGYSGACGRVACCGITCIRFSFVDDAIGAYDFGACQALIGRTYCYSFPFRFCSTIIYRSN